MSNVSFEIGEDGDYKLVADVSGSKVLLQSFPAYDIDTQIGAATEAAAAAQPTTAEPPAPAADDAAGEVLVSSEAAPAAGEAAPAGNPPESPAE